MTTAQKEKLIFVEGLLEGLSWMVSDDGLGEALASVQDQIREIRRECEE